MQGGLASDPLRLFTKSDRLGHACRVGDLDGQPSSAGDPLVKLRNRLQRIHRHNGEPSTREISRRTGKAISHTTVNLVLRCIKNPRWGQLELVVEALGGNVDEFRSLWIAVRDAEDGPATAAIPQASASVRPTDANEGVARYAVPIDPQPRQSEPVAEPTDVADQRGEIAKSSPFLTAFAAPNSRSDRTIAVINIVDWSTLKEQYPQATWLNSLGQLYDTVTATIAREVVPGVVVKYLNDGVMLSFDIAQTTDAMNVVIRVQETIDQAGREGRATPLACSIGVSTGEAVRFVGAGGNLEFVGNVVDKALRLCGAANPKAIFVDTLTVANAMIDQLQSRFGVAVRRRSEEYVGGVQRIYLKGFNEPTGYHELLWDQQLYGLRSAVITQFASRLGGRG
jgi:class 3 adenylate cyclase